MSGLVAKLDIYRRIKGIYVEREIIINNRISIVENVI